MSTVLFHPLPRAVSCLQCELVTGFARLEALAGEWRRLWAADPDRHVFLSWPWVQAWWRAYGDVHRLCAAVVWDGAELAGVLPLVEEGGCLHFLGSPESDYTDILCGDERAPEIVAAALRSVLAVSPGWRSCVLDNLPENSRIVRSLPRLDAALRTRLLLSFRAACPAITADPSEPDPFRRRSRKESIRRHDRKLKSLGEVSFRHLASRAEIRQHLEGFVRQHIARRAVAGDRSLLLDSRAVEFCRYLAEELDPAAELRFSVLEAGGKALGYHLGFECGGRFIWYKPAFDVDYWDWSPGEVLLGRLLEYASSKGLHELDFTIGDEAFKYRFANTVRRVYRLRISAPGTRGAALSLLHRCRERAKRSAALRRVKKAADMVSERVRAPAAGRGAVAQYLWNRVLRSVIAWDEALLFYAGPGELAPAPADVAVTTARLSDLARLSVDDPERFDCAYVRTAREWLRRGDTCHIVRRSGEPVHVAWRSGTNAAEVAGRSLTLCDPAANLFVPGLEGARRNGTVSPGLLSAVAPAGSAAGSGAWIWCGARDRLSRAAIEAAGFRPVCRLIGLRFFNRFRWSRVYRP